ncbi:PEP-CTERM sorting domain-containing protein [Sedimenticola selenatireducens]|uniref:PEP-CTERM sorting domain-containing protein n=1 Tax=Sedimenticola selenatireducens TaxID=191960 RepID=A0A558DTQ1_9GAMM|nr:PEP-CTERM sorting domain-containing protein [Sedimenticola selenatireducens]TVO76988.1 PEP-CTERM sorting domain-containing protein [Sedimenticola selenatireducens]TVT64431.1 MAG: PEP-CTERM sorting domain-containing protein [Sedimenticola selenatireducens]
MKKITTVLAFIGIMLCLNANAAIIVGATTTTDTAQGLEFLHIPEYTTTSDYATALAGISHASSNWALATVEQFLTLLSNATGVPLAAWNGSNHGDTDFSSSQADAMMASLGYGLSSITDGPWVWLNGGAFGPSEFAAHTDCCDDFHLNQTVASDINTGFYVRSAAISVPEPGTLAILFAGLLGFRLAQHRKIS